jgi:hypothetical protein
VAGFGCVADDFVEYLVSLYGNRGKPFSSKKKIYYILKAQYGGLK